MSDLGKKFKQSIAWDIGRTAYSQVFSFVLSIILARLLTPADFGLVSMCYVVLRIAQVFSDVGFSSALIQDKVVDNKSLSTVFWINISSGTVLFLLIETFSFAIADFYDQPQLTLLIRVLGFIFLIDSLCQVQSTILKKNLDFKIINKIVIISNTCSGVIAISSALAGFGIWSLVIQALSDSFINFILYWSYSKWKPNLYFNLAEARRLFKFGSFVFFNQLVYRVSSRADDLIIGKFFSPTILGFYNRAGSVLSLVKKYSSSSIIRIVYPYFSLLKTDENLFLKKYNQIIDLLYFVVFFISGIFFLGGQEMITLVYGDQWVKAGEYFEIVSLTIFIYPVNAVMSNALLSQGFSKLNFNISMATVLMRVFSMLLVVYAIGNFEALLYAQVLISIIINVAYIYVLGKYVKVSIRYQIVQFLKFLAITAFLILLILELSQLITNFAPILRLAIIAVVYAVAYLACNYFVNKRIVMDYISRIKSFRK